MDRYDDPTAVERLGRHVGALRPVPVAVLAAAIELPITLRALREIDVQVLEGHVSREARTAELEEALARAGTEATPDRLAALERQLALRDDG